MIKRFRIRSIFTIISTILVFIKRDDAVQGVNKIKGYGGTFVGAQAESKAQRRLTTGRQSKYQMDNHGNNLPSTICRIVLVSTTYLANEKNESDSSFKLPLRQGTYKQHMFRTRRNPACLPIISGKESDDLLPLLNFPQRLIDDNVMKMQQGNFFVRIRNASLSTEGFGLNLSEYSSFEVYEDQKRGLQRVDTQEMTWKPTITVSVIRISTLDSTPSDSTEALRATLFDPNGINFRTQYEACSFGQLKIFPSPVGDIIDVQVNQPIQNFKDSYDNLINVAQETLKAANPSITSIDTIADRIIFCLPPGTGTWTGSATVRHWRIQMNDKWCHSLTGLMHELGHTFGLQHSHADGYEYYDRTGYMGSGGIDPITPQKCFNGFNSFQFGWYLSRTQYLDPLAERSSFINLATFVDMDRSLPSEPVLLVVDNTYFLQYNRAKSFNVGTEQKRDQVTITQPIESGTDSLMGLYVGGPTFQVPNYKGSGRTLYMVACNTITSALGADVMILSVSFDTSVCPSPTTSPTNIPISLPTNVPVSFPTNIPISLPTSIPISSTTSILTGSPAIVQPVLVTTQPITSPPTTKPSFLPTYTPSSAPQTRSPETLKPISKKPQTNKPTAKETRAPNSYIPPSTWQQTVNSSNTNTTGLTKPDLKDNPFVLYDQQYNSSLNSTREQFTDLALILVDTDNKISDVGAIIQAINTSSSNKNTTSNIGGNAANSKNQTVGGGNVDVDGTDVQGNFTNSTTVAIVKDLGGSSTISLNQYNAN